MKKTVKIIVPILLVLAIVFGMAWYLFVYDRDFTRDMLLQGARYFDQQGRHVIGSWFYDLAYNLSGDNDQVAIELAEQHKQDGNYTQAEATLSRAIEDGGGIDLYIALSQTYVEQDKLLDAVKLLNGVSSVEIKEQLDALRPAAPVATPAPGFYNQYISVDVESDSGTLYVNPIAEYPSVHSEPYSAPITLADGENTIYAVSVSDNGLVSPLSIFGYTVGGVIEEVSFSDQSFEQYIRQLLGADENKILYSNDLWDITVLEVPSDVESFEDLKYMAFLEELTIAEGADGDLSVLSGLSNLKKLSVSGISISTEEFSVICTLSKLESLTLSNCSLSSISGLENLTGLTYIDLSNNAIRNITPLASLSALQELYLQHNALTDLDSLSKNLSLAVLDISYNSLSELDPISELEALTWLDVSHNQITSISPIKNLRQLTHFYGSSNSITKVNAVSELANMQVMNIADNQISDISSLSGLSNLEDLDFSNNQVETLPAFSQDCALVTINGSHNLLSELDPLAGLDRLNNVYMDYNEEIESVECLSSCHVLVLVNVYGTKVTEVASLTDQGVVVNFDPTQNKS